MCLRLLASSDQLRPADQHNRVGDQPNLPTFCGSQVQGDLAVSIFVEEGDLASTTVGPLMDDFLTSVHEQDLD